MKILQSLFMVSVIAFLCACSEEKDTSGKTRRQGPAKGGIEYGGILRLNEVESIKSLFPIAINEINSYHISTQIYEGLVKYNSADMNVVPALARTWELSDDRTEYTFHLRTGVKFHDDTCFTGGIGRMVNAQDVKYCFESLCSKHINNTQYDVTFKDRVDGANDFFAESLSGKVRTFRGIHVVDDSTIRIRLVHPDGNFLNILTMPGCYVYPREAVKMYGNAMRMTCVGTGPFYMEQVAEGDSIVLKRNPDYWAYDSLGNQLPYLDGIYWTFNRDKNNEIEQFRSGKLDMVTQIPVEMVHDLVGEIQNNKGKLDFEIYSSPALTTHFYGFNLQTNPFFSIREIRRAFNLAVDRDRLVETTLRGEGSPAKFGIVPYTDVFERNGYDYASLKGYAFNPDSARKLLTLAGYPGGKGLPEFKLEINSGGGDKNILVAVAVQKMLKDNLGVNVTMNVVPFPEHLENVQSGKSDFFRYAWTSDYADPESFLTLFFGQHVPENYTDPSYINLTRFKDPGFDILFAAASAEQDIKKRYRLLSKAEQNIIDEAPVMPLFYDQNYRIVRRNIRNLPENPLNLIDLTTTYRLSGNK